MFVQCQTAKKENVKFTIIKIFKVKKSSSSVLIAPSGAWSYKKDYIIKMFN